MMLITDRLIRIKRWVRSFLLVIAKALAILILALGLYEGTPAFGAPLIAFESKRSGIYDIYVIDLANGKDRRLTDHPAYDGQPSWSPDGRQIAFTSDRDGDLEIYVMNADGSNPKNLTNRRGDFPNGIDRDS